MTMDSNEQYQNDMIATVDRHGVPTSPTAYHAIMDNQPSPNLLDELDLFTFREALLGDSCNKKKRRHSEEINTQARTERVEYQPEDLIARATQWISLTEGPLEDANCSVAQDDDIAHEDDKIDLMIDSLNAEFHAEVLNIHALMDGDSKVSRKLAQLEQEVRTLTIENQSIHQNYTRKIKKINADHSNEQKRLEQVHREKMDSIRRSFENVLIERESKIASLQESYDLMEQELLETLDQLEGYQEEIELGNTGKNELHLLQVQIENLQRELSASRSSLHMHEKDNAIQELQNRCQELQKQLACASVRIRTLERERDEAISSLHDEINDLRRQLHEASNARTSLQKELLDSQEYKVKRFEEERNHAMSRASEFERVSIFLRNEVEKVHIDLMKVLEKCNQHSLIQEENVSSLCERSSAILDALKDFDISSDTGRFRLYLHLQDRGGSIEPMDATKSCLDDIGGGTTKVKDSIVTQEISGSRGFTTLEQPVVICHNNLHSCATLKQGTGADSQQSIAKINRSVTLGKPPAIPSSVKAKDSRLKPLIPTIPKHTSGSSHTKFDLRSTSPRIARSMTSQKDKESSSRNNSQPRSIVTINGTKPPGSRASSLPTRKGTIAGLRGSLAIETMVTSAPSNIRSSILIPQPLSKIPVATLKNQAASVAGRNTDSSNSRASTRFDQVPENNQQLPGPAPSSCDSDSNDKSDEETKSLSPKDLIKNVLRTLSPENAKASQTRPSNDDTVEEMIESIPVDPHSKENFDSFPAQLKCFRESLSGKESSKRSNSSSSSSELHQSLKRYKYETPNYSAATPYKTVNKMTPLISIRYEQCFTPLVVRNEVVDVLSPEDLLLSPKITTMNSQESMAIEGPKCKKQQHRRKEACFKNNKRSPIMIQKCWRENSNDQRTSEKLNAATMIQRVVRRYLAASAYARIRLATVRVQACVRSAIVQREAKRRLRAVMSIQTRYRCHARATEYRAWRKAAVAMQAWVRGAQSRHSVAAMREGAIRVQQYYRGYARRIAYRRFRCSLVRFQAVARGYVARQNRWSEEHAATMIQRVVRRYLAASAYARIRLATVRVQACVRSAIVQREAKRRLRAVMSIQTRYRCHARATEYRAWRNAAVAIQAWVRGAQSRHSVAAVREGAIRVQQYYRGYARRIAYRRFRCSLVRFQAVVRGYVARQNRWSEEHAATMIQRVVRRYLAASAYARIRLATVRVQACVRSAIVQREAKRRLRAVMSIQTRYRCHARATEYRAWRNAAVAIQAWVRGAQSRHSVAAMREGAIRVQQYYRGYARRIAYRRFRCSLVRFQAVARGYVARQNRWSEEHAATMIQRVVRRYLAASAYARIRLATVRVQACVRSAIVQREAKRRLRAVMSIQTRYRCHARATEYRAWRNAAVAIQAWVRGAQSRHSVAAMREGAIRVQQYYRGYARRIAYRRFRCSLVRFQAVARGYVARQNRWSEEHAATMIQRVVRRYLAASAYARIRLATVRVQACVRSAIVQREAKRRLRAVMSIQTWYRCHARATEYRAWRKAAVAMQAWVRGAQSRHSVAAMREGAIRVQQYYRGYARRIAYRRFRCSLVRFQAVARGYVARQNRWSEEHAATMIQRVVRRYLAASAYARIRLATVRVQACVRSAIVQREAKRRLRAVMSIQTRYRCHARATEYRAWRNAAVAIQAWVRGAQSRHSVAAMREGAIRVQQYYRGYARRIAYRRFRCSLVRFQAVARGYVIRRWFKNLICRQNRIASTSHRERSFQTNICPPMMDHQKDGRSLLGSIPNRIESISATIEACHVRRPLALVSKSKAVLKQRKPRGSSCLHADITDGENCANSSSSGYQRMSYFGLPKDHDQCAVNTDLMSFSCAPDCKSMSKSTKSIDKMKVVELRGELETFGVEKRVLRNLRKAQLVDLLRGMRAGMELAR